MDSLMPWHLDQYGKVKQGVSIFKTYIGNIDRASILPIYRTFSSSWSSLTGNEIPAPKTLAKIYNEPFLTLNANNPSINKTRFIYLFIYYQKGSFQCNTSRLYNRG